MSSNNVIIELQSIVTGLETQIASVKDNYKSIQSDSTTYVALIDVIDTRFGYINDLMIRINDSIDALISYDNLDEGFYNKERVYKCFSFEESTKIEAIKDNSICKDFAVDSNLTLKHFQPKYLAGSYSDIGCFDKKGRFSCKVPLYNQIIKNYNNVIKYSKEVIRYLRDINAFISARSHAVTLFNIINNEKTTFMNKLDELKSKIPTKLSAEDLTKNHISPDLISTIEDSITNNLNSQVSCYAAATAFATNSCYQDFLNSCGSISRVMTSQIEYLLAVIRLLNEFDSYNIKINEINAKRNDWLDWGPLTRNEPLSDDTFNYHLYTGGGANGCYAWNDVDAKVSIDCFNKFCDIGDLKCNTINLEDHVMIGITSTNEHTKKLRPTTVDDRYLGNWVNNPGQMNCHAGWGKAVCALRNRKVYDDYNAQITVLENQKKLVSDTIFNLKYDEIPPAPVKCCSQSVYCPNGQCNVVQSCNLTVDGITDVTTTVTHIDEIFTANLIAKPSEVSGQRDTNNDIKQFCWNKDNAKINDQCMGGFVLKTDGNCYAPPNVNQDCSPYSWSDFSEASNVDLNFYASVCKLRNPSNCPSYSSILQNDNAVPDQNPSDSNLNNRLPVGNDRTIIINVNPEILNPKIPGSKKPIILPKNPVPTTQSVPSTNSILSTNSEQTTQSVSSIQPVSATNSIPIIQPVSATNSIPIVQPVSATNSIPIVQPTQISTFWDDYKIIIIIVVVLIICSCCAFLFKN
jgi:hypothetical protein